MKMRACAPISRAAHATACPWLPALAATTSLASRVEMRLYAPRILNEPVRWRFSVLSRTSRPTSRENVSDWYAVETRATPSRRVRAASMSASVGAVFVAANVEHLLHDLSDGAQRVELPTLYLVQEPPELGIVGDRAFEVPFRARGGDGEDLAGEVARSPLGELSRRLEVRAVRLDLLPELGDVLAARRLGEHDRRPPLAVLVQREDGTHLVQHRLRRRMIQLVDRDHVGDLHDPRLQRLHGVAGAGHEHERDGVGDADHLHLALPRAHRLEEDDVLAGGVEDEQRLQRRLGEAAEMAARPHRPDEDARVEEVVGQADAVAEQGALREGA